MKVVKTILRYIITTILALSILMLVLINIFSSTIFNENYILSELEEEDYYSKIYDMAEDNFEKYINQSGLDESVLEGIITKEKVEKDSKIILDNIFNGTNEEVDTKEIEDKLNDNIKESLGGSIASSQQSAINTFVSTTCEEYKDTISHTNYEERINTYYNKIINYIDIANKTLLIVTGVAIVLLILLNLKRIYRITAYLGVGLTVSGLICIIIDQFINSKVNIQGITILNDAISVVLRNILTDVMNKIMSYGCILLAAGIILIIVFALIKSLRKIKREKDQYNPEN